MKLTLLRHGITEGNARHLYYGSTDLPLPPQGREALERLRREWVYPAGTRYYTSGMRRTEETLLALYGPVAHEILPDLREIDFGAFEMRTYEALKEDPAYQRWITGNVEANVCPGGESGVGVTRRALLALEPVLAGQQDAVCITHGGVIGGLLAHWFPETTRYDWTPEPGQGFQVNFQAGAPVSATPVPFPGSALE